MLKVITVCFLLFLVSLLPLVPTAHANVEADDPGGIKTYKLHRYVADLGYRSDRIDLLQHPSLTLAWGGDCEDLAFLLWLLLKIEGIDDVSFAYGRCNKVNHCWIESHGTLYDPAYRFTQNAEYAHSHDGYGQKIKLTW